MKGLNSHSTNDLSFLTSEHAVKYVDQLAKSTEPDEANPVKLLNDICKEMKPKLAKKS